MFTHSLCDVKKKKNGSKMSQCKDIENRILNHSSTIGKWRKNWPTISSRKIFTNVQESRRNTSIRHLNLTLYGLIRNAADMFPAVRNLCRTPTSRGRRVSQSMTRERETELNHSTMHQVNATATCKSLCVCCSQRIGRNICDARFIHCIEFRSDPFRLWILPCGEGRHTSTCTNAFLSSSMRNSLTPGRISRTRRRVTQDTTSQETKR